MIGQTNSLAVFPYVENCFDLGAFDPKKTPKYLEELYGRIPPLQLRHSHANYL